MIACSIIHYVKHGGFLLGLLSFAYPICITLTTVPAQYLVTAAGTVPRLEKTQRKMSDDSKVSTKDSKNCCTRLTDFIIGKFEAFFFGLVQLLFLIYIHAVINL